MTKKKSKRKTSNRNGETPTQKNTRHIAGLKARVKSLETVVAFLWKRSQGESLPPAGKG